ncbi:MAG: hypothetical protein AB7O80_24785 [Acetobacteraceae bacterium]
MSHDTLPAHSSLARLQVSLYDNLGTAAGLTMDARRTLLDLSEQEWTAWMAFLNDGPLPSCPPLPEMLMRVAAALYHLELNDGDRVPAGGDEW